MGRRKLFDDGKQKDAAFKGGQRGEAVFQPLAPVDRFGRWLGDTADHVPASVKSDKELQSQVIALKPFRLSRHQFQAEADIFIADILRPGQQSRMPAEIGDQRNNIIELAGHGRDLH